MAKVDRIQDERLRASMQSAHAPLRAGDHRDVVQRAGEAYIELLRRKPELLQGEGFGAGAYILALMDYYSIDR